MKKLRKELKYRDPILKIHQYCHRHQKKIYGQERPYRKNEKD